MERKREAAHDMLFAAGMPIVARRISEESAAEPFNPWWVILFIVIYLILIFACIPCCVVNCFRPENSAGPRWYPSANKNNCEAESRILYPNDKAHGWRRILRPTVPVPVPPPKQAALPPYIVPGFRR